MKHVKSKRTQIKSGNNGDRISPKAPPSLPAMVQQAKGTATATSERRGQKQTVLHREAARALHILNQEQHIHHQQQLGPWQQQQAALLSQKSRSAGETPAVNRDRAVKTLKCAVTLLSE